ncbi:AbrB/MazE/SpoVT family DNA-binding domain-containing protein [Pseudomonas sp. NPDC087336]|uniref:AbrB/MazE/SpoVT family DNA-binding domain-containing protein n=1 Tax=Pseudomonas sp. NPDC087336 TaxID=3364436 RepID=UPI0037FE5FA5
MSDSQSWTVKSHDSADGSGEMIVSLPPELLTSLGLVLDDELTIEIIDGGIVLKPVHLRGELI